MQENRLFATVFLGSGTLGRLRRLCIRGGLLDGSQMVDWTFLVFPVWVLIVSCDILVRAHHSGEPDA